MIFNDLSKFLKGLQNLEDNRLYLILFIHINQDSNNLEELFKGIFPEKS